MGLKAAVQALKKAEELKAKVTRHNDLLNNSEVWSDQQQLQTVYHQVLVLDLEYALDKKVEQELWTLGFKNHIAALQQLSRDKKNPRRSECQALLTWCLEAASGFYLTLLQELCSAFELDLPFRRRGAIYGQTKPWPNSEQLTQPHKSSCLYICQYCLVHLGDIARYRSQRKQAESFYRHAILLSPSSGQPYNQLALLEASRGDKLGTVFHYVRSISVRHPFPAAATNLTNTLSAVIDNDDPLTEVHSKLSLTEFITMFLRVHGLLHLATDLDQAELCVKSLNATFTALVATQAFSSIKLVQMTAINLYALKHTVDAFSNNQLSQDELRVKNLVLDMLAGAFSAYLLPIYTMSNDKTVLDYYALPAIKLTLDWIKTDPSVLCEHVFTKRLQIWPSLCKILNYLQENVGVFEHKKSDKMPLPEDRDLQCFLPLVNSFEGLDFTCEQLKNDAAFFNKLRVVRLTNLGIWLSTQTVNDDVLITSKKISNSKILFEPSSKQPDPTPEILEEIKHFNIKESNDQIKENIKTIKAPEKRGGILKPQGSLEKAREEREQALLLTTTDSGDSSNNTSLNNVSATSARIETSKLKRVRQNVAMQALAKKVEENKQVTFQTEPIVKAKDKPQPKSHEQFTSKSISDITVPILNTNLVTKSISDSTVSPPIDTSRLQQHHLSLGPTIPISNPNEISPNNSYQNAVNSCQLPLSFNQTPNFTRPPVNVSNVPFSVPYQNNSPNLSFHNSHSNIPYPRQQQSNIFNTSSSMPPPTKNTGFNIPFDTNVPSTTPIGYPSNQPKEQYSLWQRDTKLPMPPSTWWTNNQKSLPQNFANQPAQNDLFNQPYSFNVNTVNNTSLGYMPDNLKSTHDYNMHYNTGIGSPGVYNNISMWNTGPNIQSNLHMLLNQSGQQMIHQQPQNQSQTFGDENNGKSSSTNARDINDTQSNSMPGYSLFNSNWAPNLTVHSSLKNSPPDRSPSMMRQQSLFSGPGPSPLERLLEQQKQLRGSKEDT